MASPWDGMNAKERHGMPMIGEATGIFLARALIARPKYKIHPLQVRVALRQERYIREVLLRCPRWRRRKRRLLAGALSRAVVVSDCNLRLASFLRQPRPQEGEPR